MAISRIDHVVLTARDMSATIDFYTNMLGMSLETFANDRKALKFGEQKINLHEYGREFEPRAHLAVPGSQDWCFIIDEPLDDLIARLNRSGIEIIEGPGPRTGAMGTIRSIYVRDPDLNLIELAHYETEDS